MWTQAKKEARGKRIAQYKAEGKCACGGVPKPTYATCDKCLAKAKRVRDRLAAQAVPGKVCWCGRLIDQGTSSTCATCRSIGRKADKIRYAKSLERHAKEGICVKRCDNLAMPDRTECEECWWKVMAQHHLLSASRATDLQSLLKSQEGRCALTGFPLEPPFIELDHIVPLGQGGSTELENMQLMLPIVNRIKAHLRQDELFAFCRLVVAHNEGKVSEEAALRGAAKQPNVGCKTGRK